MDDDSYTYYTNVITASLYGLFGKEHIVRAKYTPARLYSVLYARMLLSGVQIIAAVLGIILYVVAMATPGGATKSINMWELVIIITLGTLWAVPGFMVNTFKIDSDTDKYLRNATIAVCLLGLLIPSGSLVNAIWLGVEIVMMGLIGVSTIYWDTVLMDLVESDEVDTLRAQDKEAKKTKE